MINERRRHNTGPIRQCCETIVQCTIRGITLVKDKLLTLIVVVGTLVVCWIVLRDQHPKRQSRTSGYDGSGGADAGGEGGGHGWFGDHSHSGDHGGSGDAGGSDGGDGGGVTAAGVAATEVSTLASVDLLPRRLFRFIPV
jgi:hypothetical protein